MAVSPRPFRRGQLSSLNFPGHGATQPTPLKWDLILICSLPWARSSRGAGPVLFGQHRDPVPLGLVICCVHSHVRTCAGRHMAALTHARPCTARRPHVGPGSLRNHPCPPPAPDHCLRDHGRHAGGGGGCSLPGLHLRSGEAPVAGTRASAERWAPPAGPRRTALRVLKFPNPDGCSGMELGPRSDLWLSWFGPVLDGAPLPLSICTGEKDPRPQHPSPSGLMGTTLTLGVPTEPLDHSPTARSPHGSCFPQGKATVSSAGSSPLSLPWGPSAPLAHTHLHLRACALCPRALPQTSAPPAHGLLRSGPPPPLVSQLPGGGVPVPPGPCQVLRAQHAPGTQEALHRSLLSAESAALGKRVNVADGLLPTQGQRPRKHLRSLSRVCVCVCVVSARPSCGLRAQYWGH